MAGGMVTAHQAAEIDRLRATLERIREQLLAMTQQRDLLRRGHLTTRVDEIRAAIANPGAVLSRGVRDNGVPETVASWSARAVVAILGGQDLAPDGQSIHGHGQYLPDTPFADPRGDRGYSVEIDADGLTVYCDDGLSTMSEETACAVYEALGRWLAGRRPSLIEPVTADGLAPLVADFLAKWKDRDRDRGSRWTTIQHPYTIAAWEDPDVDEALRNGGVIQIVYYPGTPGIQDDDGVVDPPEPAGYVTTLWDGCGGEITSGASEESALDALRRLRPPARAQDDEDAVEPGREYAPGREYTTDEAAAMYDEYQAG